MLHSRQHCQTAIVGRCLPATACLFVIFPVCHLALSAAVHFLAASAALDAINCHTTCYAYTGSLPINLVPAASAMCADTVCTARIQEGLDFLTLLLLSYCFDGCGFVDTATFLVDSRDGTD